ncbi:MAG: sialidase family protein [Chloroflexota bacterium]
MNKQRIGVALLAIALLSVFWSAPAQAQGGGWSEPYRLSSGAGRSSEGYLATDRYGYVHCFWTETLFENGRVVIKYARFDGTTWTKPNDIYVTSQGIKNVSPFVDKQGTLHIAWSEGLYDVRAYYTYAPANNALSAQNWAKPIQINVVARPLYLRVDSSGVLHILYTNQTEETGVYYIRSEDRGITWSEPVWLDPDILPDHVPDSLNFELDENDGLHAVWWYGGLEQSRPDWVRYAHSLDGGHTWSSPFLIDQYREETDHNLTNASPRMIVQGQTVHVIWAAGSLPYRYHRFSADAGLTWSEPVQILGELHGQAGDGLAIDSSGRVHLFSQIRYPMGIWHSYWDQTRWSKPSLVYLIAEEGSEESIGDRVHAHDTLPVLRAGSQLVLTFADGQADPNRRLFVVYRSLEDIMPLETMATPVPTATTVPTSSPTPWQPAPMTSQIAAAPSPESAEVQPVGRVPGPDLTIRVALVPTLLVLGVTMIFQFLNRRRQ